MAERLENFTSKSGDDAEMMSDKTLERLMEYLKSIGWSNTQIIELLEYITKK